MEKVNVVARSFQAGTGTSEKPFKMEDFLDRVANPIKNLLRFHESVGSIIVVTNGEKGNRLAEIFSDDGKTPTVRALEETFPKEVENGTIIPHICMNWGPNPGSGNALNEGMKIATGDGSKWVMCWSPEIEMNGYRITEMLTLAEQRNLMVIGIMRKFYWEKPQWNVVQNTACLWQADIISSINGFAPECNGTGECVKTLEYGDVPLAGMEDFHAMLRIMKKYGDDFRWGLIGRTDPLFWRTDFEPGSERLMNHLKKVARQYLVMEAYINKIFPGEDFREVLERFFSCKHQD